MQNQLGKQPANAQESPCTHTRPGRIYEIVTALHEVKGGQAGESYQNGDITFLELNKLIARQVEMLQGGDLRHSRREPGKVIVSQLEDDQALS